MKKSIVAFLVIVSAITAMADNASKVSYLINEEDKTVLSSYDVETLMWQITVTAHVSKNSSTAPTSEIAIQRFDIVVGPMEITDTQMKEILPEHYTELMESLTSETMDTEEILRSYFTLSIVGILQE